DAVWGRATDAGLRRLTAYEPRKASPGDPDDYALFRSAAAALMRDYDIPPELLDFVLGAASSFKVDHEPVPSGGNVWLFQANPKIYDIDRALSELSEVDWVVRQYRNDIHAGDRVYIWRSGPEAGVIATAEVLAEPEIAAVTSTGRWRHAQATASAVGCALVTHERKLDLDLTVPLDESAQNRV